MGAMLPASPGIVGLLIGSFLDVVIGRVPYEPSVPRGRSCGTRIFAVTPDLRRVESEISVSRGTERRAAALPTSITRRPQARIGGAPCF